MYRKITKFTILLLSILMTLTLSSCVGEDMGDCRMTVRFVYNHNVLSANAFGSQVDQVMLYVFDENGVLVQKHFNGTSKLTNEFSIRLNKLQHGRHRLVAWAQSSHLTSEQSFFLIPELTEGISTIDELTYKIKREGNIQRHELNNLLVGMTESTIGHNDVFLPVTINLKKVTNKIKVVLMPYVSGGTLDVANYNFSVVDKSGNGHINYDYSLLPDKQITYIPYYAANLEPKNNYSLFPDEIDMAAIVEINTSRLTKENAPRLLITDKKDGREIVSINLPWFFSLINMEIHKEWSLQEYLDRQDMFAITLFFDEGIWMSGKIIINGWVINYKEINF